MSRAVPDSSNLWARVEIYWINIGADKSVTIFSAEICRENRHAREISGEISDRRPRTWFMAASDDNANTLASIWFPKKQTLDRTLQLQHRFYLPLT